MRSSCVLLAVAGAVAAASPAFAGATLVTTAKGDVQLVEHGSRSTPPTPPFVLGPDQTLAIGAGGSVVVLHDGSATQLLGPATLDPGNLAHPTDAAMPTSGVLDEILARDASSARAGATRGGGDLQLLRPIAGTAVLSLHDIRWTCAGCGPQDVQIYDFGAGTVAWSRTGDGHLAYDGPALHPGAWSVSVGGRDFPFLVLPADQAAKVQAARKVADDAAAGLKKQGIADPAVLVALPASVYAEAGLPSEALYLVDLALVAHPGDADLVKLRSDLEKRTP